MIKVKNLSKSFGSLKAIDGLSFEVKKREVVGFLGPNGAGKTTSMRILTGYYSPDKGTVEIAGIPLGKETPKAQKHIGYLPEDNPLYDEMLVSEFFDLAASLKQIPKDKRKKAFDFAVSAGRIGDVFYRPIGELSRGYKQRVGLSAALLHRPDILILDEPTEGLDPNQRSQIRKLIRSLAKDRTIILSTHIMQEAQAVSDRLIIINKGKIVADGTVKQLSSSFSGRKVVFADIEGEKVKSELKSLSQAEKLKVKSLGKQRFRAKIIAGKTAKIQPELSRLVHKNKWTLWEVKEKKDTLEDIFYKLTREND